MKHLSPETLSAYIRDQLPDEARAALEEHLYGCEACLEVYMDGLGEAQTELPDLTDAERWTDRIMDQVMPRPTRRWYQSPVFHYGIAAAIMLVLTASGLFRGIAWEPKEWKSPSPPAERIESSYSERLMYQTLAVIDHIKEKREAGHE